jgi:SH3 domain protein
LTSFKAYLVISLLIGAVWGTPQEARAEKKWVSDVLYIPVRTGASGQHRILRHIKSGMAVNVLAKPEGSEYVKVEVLDEEKTQGWVIGRYLLAEPIAELKLARLEKRMASLRESQTPLQKSVDKLKSELAESRAANEELQKKNTNMTEQLNEIKQVSSEEIKVYEVNNELKKEQDALMTRLERLQQQNEMLSTDRRNEGIKLGLLAVALGCLAGFLLPYLKPRSRKSRSVRLR